MKGSDEKLEELKTGTVDRSVAIRDPLEGSLSYELRRASVATMAALSDTLEPLGLRPSDASMLMIVGANPGRMQSDVGRALRVQPANMVPMINRLELAGLVQRTPSDGRAMALYLTKQGQTMLETVTDLMARHEIRVTRSMPEHLREEIIKALRMVVYDACCEMDGPPEPPAED